MIKDNCNFDIYFKKIDIKPSVLDGGHEIVLAKWPSYKKMVCSFNNNIPLNIPSHPYVLLNQSILCNCNVEAESNFLLEFLAACDPSITDLVLYFTTNLAFVKDFDILLDSLDASILQNWTTLQQILPISLQSFYLLCRPLSKIYKRNTQKKDPQGQNAIYTCFNQFINKQTESLCILKLH